MGCSTNNMGNGWIWVCFEMGYIQFLEWENKVPKNFGRICEYHWHGSEDGNCSNYGCHVMRLNGSSIEPLRTSPCFNIKHIECGALKIVDLVYDYNNYIGFMWVISVVRWNCKPTYNWWRAPLCRTMEHIGTGEMALNLESSFENYIS
jgi:hypothetical protein